MRAKLKSSSASTHLQNPTLMPHRAGTKSVLSDWGARFWVGGKGFRLPAQPSSSPHHSSATQDARKHIRARISGVKRYFATFSRVRDEYCPARRLSHRRFDLKKEARAKLGDLNAIMRGRCDVTREASYPSAP